MMRDARPMAGSLAGHTLAWPTPDLITHALRGALHRSKINCHRHEYHPRGRTRTNGNYQNRISLYGSVLQAGPFPVRKKGEQMQWYLPCPLDVDLRVAAPTGLPLQQELTNNTTLPAPLKYSVVSLCAPSKENRAPVWLSTTAWEQYVQASAEGHIGHTEAMLAPADGIGYADVADFEHHYGIARKDNTGTVKDGSFYSYTGLRLKPGWHMGSWVSSSEKMGDYTRKDVLKELFGQERHIVVGGQQRLCTAELCSTGVLPLPAMPQLRADADGKVRVKWVLITPAIWSRHGEHPGGWLPGWVHATNGQVLLQGGDRERRENERRDEWRSRLREQRHEIEARLVAAVVGKPICISGYAAAGRADESTGPKCTHSAAPAGSVYYFECESIAAAEQLCRALHCTASPTLNRRSELLGEQGFGLGICTTWHFSH